MLKHDTYMNTDSLLFEKFRGIDETLDKTLNKIEI